MTAVLNPATEETIAEVEASSAEQTDAAVARAKAAFGPFSARMFRTLTIKSCRIAISISALRSICLSSPWGNDARAIDFCGAAPS